MPKGIKGSGKKSPKPTPANPAKPKANRRTDPKSTFENPQPRRWYSDDERALILTALDANGGDIDKTAAELNVPRSTLHSWAVGSRCPEALVLRQEKKGHLANAAEEIAWQIAALIPSRLDEATPQQLFVGFGIMVDKTKLLRGEATTITDNLNKNVTATLADLVQNMTPDERNELRTIMERAAARRVVTSNPGTMASGT